MPWPATPSIVVAEQALALPIERLLPRSTLTSPGGDVHIEIMQDRLYWSKDVGDKPRDTATVLYLATDRNYVYEAFAQDFGPLKLSLIHRFCNRLEQILADLQHQGKRVIVYSSGSPKVQANSVFLVGCYQIALLQRTAEEAYAPFSKIEPPLPAYRDAARGPCTHECTLLDCLRGFSKSIRVGWYDRRHFDATAFDTDALPSKGDMAWVIPEKFLAFATPSAQKVDQDGERRLTPQDYVPMFQKMGIVLVVRLNEPEYDAKHFIKRKIKHADMQFPDGSSPQPELVDEFLEICAAQKGAIAVHCKAGLGRTGTLIGLYAMKNFGFKAREFIAWCRICRPGSILGPQQEYLFAMETAMLGECSVIEASPKSTMEHRDSGQGVYLSNIKRSSEKSGEGSKGRKRSRIAELKKFMACMCNSA
eukprot:NODE_6040_length_1710_cov_26.771320.p1 GENE.NODE_6040_length_1710_cov_26.771320~~NODE_6040_length_1710_cov_26.771320.p1  ORF type:complete len:420 (-),score=70.07 NODE_6040_length_1710_cov_26.771320:249-1508(-)